MLGDVQNVVTYLDNLLQEFAIQYSLVPESVTQSRQLAMDMKFGHLL
jgi:hypothetical protein